MQPFPFLVTRSSPTERSRIVLQVWELPKERNATSEVICINNNVTNFIATLEALDFPRSAIFSLSDLESTGGEERWATAGNLL